MTWFCGGQVVPIECLEPRCFLSAIDVPSYRYDPGGSGVQSGETILTPTNVASASFGKRFTTTLDGEVYGQPLYKANVNITRGTSQGPLNVVYAATEHDSLYAIDAYSGAILWKDSFLNTNDPTGAVAPPAGVTISTLIPADVQSSTISPEIGITSTPAIDPASNLIYVEANTKEISNGHKHFVQRLWAIRLSDGTAAGVTIVGDTLFDGTPSTFNGYQYFGGPIVTGTGNNGAGSTNEDGWINSTDPNHLGYNPITSGQIAFNALLERQRTAVTIVNGVAYLAFASHGDQGPFYGWILGYRTSDLSLVAAWVAGPTYTGILGNTNFGSQAGIWTAGAKIASDSDGNLFFTTGNGAFDGTPGNFDQNGFPIDHNYADCLVELAPDPNSSFANQNGNGYGLKVVDYFCPSNQKILNAGNANPFLPKDTDLGSSGVTLFDSSDIPNHPHLLVIGGKEGRVYLIDRDNLGKYNFNYPDPPAGTSPADPRLYDHVLGEWPSQGIDQNNFRFYGPAAYFSGKIFVSLAKEHGRSFNVHDFVSYDGSGNVISPPGTTFTPSPVQSNALTYGNLGSVPLISSNGTSNAIVWWITNNSASINDALVAYDAAHLDQAPIFNSTALSANSLTSGSGSRHGVKFSIPLVDNGMVYCGTGGSIGGQLIAYGLSNLPATPGRPDLTDASDSGASNTDNVTKISTPTFTGTEPASSTVTIFVDGIANGAGVATAGGVYTITTSAIADGTHLIAVASTVSGVTSLDSVGLSVTIDTVRPTLPSASFNFDLPGQPLNLVLNFSEDILASVQTGDLSLNYVDPNGVPGSVPAASMSLVPDSANHRATWSFPGYLNGVLADGNYTAAIAASDVQDLAGNQPAENLIVPPFYFLGADANRDRTVNALDFNVLASHYGQSGMSFSQGNFNYDGIVDTLDFNFLAARFNVPLPAPDLAMVKTPSLFGDEHILPGDNVIV
jgi:hypothetical protein